jgi:spermidine synthase
VRIIDTHALGRVLVLDDKIQSAALDEHIYHEALVHPALTAHPSPSRVLILGGGEGATAREVLRHRCVREAVMVDIDGELVDICRRHLPAWHAGALRSPRLRLVVGDALAFVPACRERFDVVICDISDPEPGSPACRIYTKGFYERLGRLLAPGGLFVTQATEIFLDGSGIHAVIHATVKKALGRAESYCEHVPSFSTLWGFVAAGGSAPLGALPAATIRARLRSRRVRTRYYNAETHARLFCLPPEVRRRIESERRVSTVRRPAFVYSPA